MIEQKEISKKMSEIDFMSNHNHDEDSNFKGKDAIIRAEDIVNKSIELEYSGVSITNHETVSSHVRILERYLHLKKLQKKYQDYIDTGQEEKIKDDKDLKKELYLLEKMKPNFKLGLGNEIYLVDSLEDVKDNYVSGVTKFWHFILIAKNDKGYEQLKQISSESAWNNWFRQNGMERVPTIKQELEDIIGDEKGNLIATSACLGGELPNAMVRYFQNGEQSAKQDIHNFINWGIDVFGKENFFIEIQPTFEKLQEEVLNEETKEFEIIQKKLKEIHPQIIVNQNAVKLSKAYGVSYTVATDSHYLKKEHRKVHEAYLKADDNERDRELGEFYASTYMMSKEEIYEALSSHLTEEEIKSAFEGTMKMHSMIEEVSLFQDVIVPSDKKIPNFKLNDTFHMYYQMYPYIGKFATSESVQDKYLLFLIEEGFKLKRQEFNDVNLARINLELETLWLVSEKLSQRLSAYYVLVRGLIQELMWKVSYVGVARGSVTGFYTCYLMGITQINPITHDLPAYRHLEAGRPELPDIDIDTESSKRTIIFDLMKEYYGFDNVLNTLTLKTEGSKSTVLTACRGIGLDNDIAQMIADIIPFERGANWTLNDCFEGNEEKERNKVTEFINEVNKYDGLKEIMLLIEGLVSGRSIHASAAYVFENGYLKQNSRMRAPNGTFITAYNMSGADRCGGLKIDVLTINTLDKLHKAIDLLIDNKIIEDKGTLKDNYDAYINPDILEYDETEMWDLVGNNELIDAFQFDSPQGQQAAKKTKPKSLAELAVANSLMRLMAEQGEEQPIDTYVKFKDDIQLWYDEMNRWGLDDEEVKVLEKHLLENYGVADTQEIIMELSMDEKISGFTVALSNKLRKAIAKKSAKVLEEVKGLFFKKGIEQGTRQKLLDYVWNVQFKRQLGYSFSKNHTMPYSCICLQEMNLAYKYDRIFWNTACLTINAGADENNANNKTTNYGKIAKAIGEIQGRGQKIALPDINKAGFEFTPNLDTHEIIFGVKGICGVGEDIAKAIIDNRPYKSFDDFYNKMQEYKNTIKDENDKKNKFGDNAIITLIKAGCFDTLENKSRIEIMRSFIQKISQPLKSLTMSNIEILKDLGLLTKEQESYEYRLYKFKKYVTDKKFFAKQVGKSASTTFYKLEQKFAEPFFFQHFETNMKENKDYEYDDNGIICVKRGSLETQFDKLTERFKQEVLNSKELLDKVNHNRFETLWQDSVEGTISKWEMDALSFYYHEHELVGINELDYCIENFFEMSEIPTVVETYLYRDKEKPRFKLGKICGTVLDKDKNKHTVTLLTVYGVVTVKFYKGQFGFYDKQLSDVDDDGKKTVTEKSWFKRGNKLLVTGYRRGDQFIPKKYVDSAYRHTLQMITGINENKELILQTERDTGDENE